MSERPRPIEEIMAALDVIDRAFCELDWIHGIVALDALQEKLDELRHNLIGSARQQYLNAYGRHLMEQSERTRMELETLQDLDRLPEASGGLSYPSREDSRRPEADSQDHPGAT
jgi:hypothetical protein